MAYITWQDAFAIRVDLIDNQHKTLIDLINRLERAAASESEQDETGRVLTALVAYTRMHFAAEERYMQQINFAGYERHKELHRELTGQVVDILHRLKNGGDITVFELLSFLKDWLINHILKEDSRIGRAVVINAHAN